MEPPARPARRDATQLARLGEGQALATALPGRAGHGTAARRAWSRAHADARARPDARTRADACPGSGARRRPWLPTSRWTAGRHEPWARPGQGLRQPGRTRSQIVMQTRLCSGAVAVVVALSGVG